MDESRLKSEGPNAKSDKFGNIVTPSDAATGKSKRRAKRFLWTDELHLRFVSAVFERTMCTDSTSPLSNAEVVTMDVLELTIEGGQLMGREEEVAGLTTEHIKSHLQKYRINYERSRLDLERLADKNAKRKLKRHQRRPTPNRDTGSSDFDSGSADQSMTSSPIQWTPNTASLQLTDEQLSLCDALLLEDEVAQHMHLTMQQRMDFHRELLLTRSVEVASSRLWPGSMNSDTSGIDSRADRFNEQLAAADTNQDQFWTNPAQLQQNEARLYGHLHQQQQHVFLQQPSSQVPDATPVASFMASRPQLLLQAAAEVEGHAADADDMDLSSWGRLSLTVGHDDDDLFGFLKES